MKKILLFLVFASASAFAQNECAGLGDPVSYSTDSAGRQHQIVCLSRSTGIMSLPFLGTISTPVLSNPFIIPGNVLIGGTVGIVGAFSPCINNGVRIVGSSCYPTIAACYAILSAGETCQLPPNYSETLTANLVLNKKKTTIQATGACQINMGTFNIQVVQGADDVSIITPFAHSSDQGGNNQGCMLVGYSGSAGAVIDIGSSAGFTYNTLIRGLSIDLASAPANTVGFRRTNGVAGPMEYDEVVGGGVSGQIGFQFIGTGALFDGTSNLTGLECNYSASSTNGKCIQFTGANQNGYSFVGGHSNTGGSANGSVCIDAAAGASRIDPGGFYCDVAATALTIESTTNTAVSGKLWADSGVTTFANFAAGSNGNHIETNTRSIGTQLVIDNGVAGTNSVKNGFDMQWNSRRWRVISEAGGTGFEVVDQSDNSQAIAKGVGGATHIDSSAGNPVRTNQNTGAGVEFWNAGASVLTIDAIGTMHPGVAAAVGLGTTALPFKNIFFSNCSSSASPAVCGSSAAGSFVIAAAGTSVTVNTTAVTANSQIFVQEDESLGTKLGVTCNTGILANPPAISARSAGVSFAVSVTAGLAVNPVCFSYFIVN